MIRYFIPGYNAYLKLALYQSSITKCQEAGYNVVLSVDNP